MAEARRSAGRLEEQGYEAFQSFLEDLSPEEEMIIHAENAYANAQSEVGYDIMEGERCPNCEQVIGPFFKLGCDCPQHSDHLFQWCSQECYDKTHEHLNG